MGAGWRNKNEVTLKYKRKSRENKILWSKRKWNDKKENRPRSGGWKRGGEYKDVKEDQQEKKMMIN